MSFHIQCIFMSMCLWFLFWFYLKLRILEVLTRGDRACNLILVPFGVRLPACFPSCFRFLDGPRVFPRPCLPACLPAGLCSCFPLLGGVSVFPLVSHVSLLFSLCWMVCPPSQVLVPFVSQLVYQFVFLLVSLCWRVRPPSYGLVSFVSQPACFPACPPACLPAGLPACLPCSPAKIFARRELRRLESSQSSGIENDVSSFTFILRCFQHIQFDSPMLLASSVWNQILAPPSDASFVVFRHLALQQSKRSRTK